MSMRHYGVETKALVLDVKDFTKLLFDNRETLNKDIFDLDLFKNANCADEVDTWDVVDYAYMIDYGTYFSEIEGQFTLWVEDNNNIVRYFRGECVVIFELKKDTLFTKYENIEEVYREYLERFRELGIKVSVQYIKNNFGKLECTYFG